MTILSAAIFDELARNYAAIVRPCLSRRPARSRSASALSILILMACDDVSPPPGGAKSSPAKPLSTPAHSPTSPAPAAPVPTPAEVQTKRLSTYAAWLEAPDEVDCDSYGLILSITWPSQHSRAVWLTEVLRIEPLFSALIDQGGIKLLDATYGLRNYGRGVDTPDISRQAYIIECKDHLACRAFAGFYGRVDQWAKLQSYCGPLPGRSGGDYPIKIEALLARPLSFPHAVCARYRSCLALSELPEESCNGLTPSATRCTEFSDCDDALKCFAEEPRDPKRMLWSDSPENLPPRRGLSLRPEVTPSSKPKPRVDF